MGRPTTGGDELCRRELLDLPEEPTGRDDRQVREDGEADDDPGDDPGGEEGTAVLHVGEEAAVERGEGQADEDPEGRAEESDGPDHLRLTDGLADRPVARGDDGGPTVAKPANRRESLAS